MEQQALKELLDNAIQDAACAALVGIGVPGKRVDECGPQVLEFVKMNLKSYAELAAALGIRDA